MQKIWQNKGVKSLIWLLAFLIVWEGIYYIGVEVSGVFKMFPGPAGILQEGKSLIQKGTLFPAVFVSLKRAVIGYVVAIVCGMVLGTLLSISHGLDAALRPFILGLQTLPSVCWVPFSILWFGLGDMQIITVIILGAVFSMAIATEHAITQVPKLYIHAAKTMGATKTQLYGKVIFPAARPQILAGMKQSWSFAWRALMSAEMVQAASGLGRILMYGRQSLNENQIMLVMLLIIIIGIVVDRYIFGIWERHLARQYGTSR